MRSVQVIVIGGGASGMMAAITASRAGKKVLLLEKMNRLGKKILATGNGRCNFTNARQTPACYRGQDVSYAWDVLRQFDQTKVLSFFHTLGVLAKERDGYYYPVSGQASTILDALCRCIHDCGIEVHLEETVRRIQSDVKRGYVVHTSKDRYQARTVILATGGKAAGVHGSTGDGYQFARELGHTLVPVVPALTSCILKGDFMKNWTGVRVQGTVSLYDDTTGSLLASDTGELQMVAYGLSGIPVFQISRFAAEALQRGHKVCIHMDILPQLTQEELLQELLTRRRAFKEWQGTELLDGLMHHKLAIVLLDSLGISGKQPVSTWPDSLPERIAARIKDWKLGVKGVSDFDKAQVCAGGVSVRELGQHTLESSLHPGLFFAGEVVDVDGICGGYNLQWAWSSGYLAGKAAVRRIDS